MAGWYKARRRLGEKPYAYLKLEKPAPHMARNALSATSLVNSHSTPKLLKRSRIVIIDNDNPALEALQRAVQTEHEITHKMNIAFSGLPIKQANIITRKKRENPQVAASR